MKTLTNPYFLFALFAFALHQFLEKIMLISLPFVDNYLDPALCTPIFLTFLLFERRVFFQQGNKYTLSTLELIVATFVIMFVSEVVFPHLSSQFTADLLDLVALSLGTVYFSIFINRPFLQ